MAAKSTIKMAANALRNATGRGRVSAGALPKTVTNKLRSGKTMDYISDGGGRLSTMGSWMASNLKSSAGGGWGAVAKQAGMSALKGGMVGGLAGGSIEAMQGGSFWEGAKEGAWNGGMGFAAARTAHRATGAVGFPLGKKGAVQQGWNMWGSTSRDSRISKPAQKLINHKSLNNATKSFMNGNR